MHFYKIIRPYSCRDRVDGVRRFIALEVVNPGCKGVEMLHGDESPDAVNAVPTNNTIFVYRAT